MGGPWVTGPLLIVCLLFHTACACRSAGLAKPSDAEHREELAVGVFVGALPSFIWPRESAFQEAIVDELHRQGIDVKDWFEDLLTNDDGDGVKATIERRVAELRLAGVGARLHRRGSG